EFNRSDIAEYPNIALFHADDITSRFWRAYSEETNQWLLANGVVPILVSNFQRRRKPADFNSMGIEFEMPESRGVENTTRLRALAEALRPVDVVVREAARRIRENVGVRIIAYRDADGLQRWQSGISSNCSLTIVETTHERTEVLRASTERL